jgi:LysR family transcriptional regulator, nitrogen assimilation regulatory protein
MSEIIKSEAISRRRALSLFGKVAVFAVAASTTATTVSDAEAQTAGMERRQERLANVLPNQDELSVRRIDVPAASLQMSLCISDNAALSDAAFAVYKVLLEIIGKTWGTSPAGLSPKPLASAP